MEKGRYKMKKISDIFYIYTGSKLDFGKQQEDENGINFVSRNSNNNGVVGKVLIDESVKTYKKGDITVPLGGSFLLSAFVQNADFVTAQNVHVLRPKDPNMSNIEKYKKRLFSIRAIFSIILCMVAYYFVSKVEKGPNYIRDLIITVLPFIIIAGIVDYISSKKAEDIEENNEEEIKDDNKNS